jgi:pyruvate-formate lyase-activating enzyme
MPLDKGSHDGTIRCIYRIGFQIEGNDHEYYMELTDDEVDVIREKLRIAESCGAISHRMTHTVTRRIEISQEELRDIIRFAAQDRVKKLNAQVVEI